MPPSRFLPPPSPGDLRLATFLEREDPLADAVVDELTQLPRAEQAELVNRMLSTSPGKLPPALATLHAWLRQPPPWFDEALSNAGGEVVLRHGLLSGLVLGFKSLVLGYCSPAGNKPLVFSGRLTEDLTVRLAETSRFVEATSTANGLRFGAPGFMATVRVRLIHARVRQALRVSPAWKADQWGAPINQYDMAGTVLLFSSQLLEGLRQLGATVTAAEEAATLHLWRHAGRLMGVEDELLSTTAGEASALWALLEATQGPPDVDSRRLTHALVLSRVDRGEPDSTMDLGYALCRHLVGPRYAEALELPRSRWDLAPWLMRQLVRRLDAALRRLPGAEARSLRVGAGAWRRVVARTFGPNEVPFALPERPLRVQRS